MPTGCDAHLFNNWSAYSVCENGPGQQRLELTCEDGITGSRMIVDGPWVLWNQHSNATCGDSSVYAVFFTSVQVES